MTFPLGSRPTAVNMDYYKSKTLELLGISSAPGPVLMLNIEHQKFVFRISFDMG